MFGPVSGYFKMFAFQSLCLLTCVWMVFVFDHQQIIYYKRVATANATLFTTYLLILSYQLTLQGPRRGRGWGGLSRPPSLFCKNKNKLNKNYLTKITEPKIAPHSKNLLRGPCIVFFRGKKTWCRDVGRLQPVGRSQPICPFASWMASMYIRWSGLSFASESLKPIQKYSFYCSAGGI